MAAALAEPVRRVRPRWTALLTLAGIGLWSAFFGPIQVLLAQQAAVFDPTNKEAVLGLVTGLGAAVSVIANPVAGALSDRTTSRLGRRHPWTVGGVLLGVASLLLLAIAPNITVLAIGWCAAQAGLNATLASLTAAVPDHVPVPQRGQVGGWVGIAQMAGVLAGTAIATTAPGTAAGYLALALLLPITTLPFVLITKDPMLPASLRSRLRLKSFIAGFWISPRENPDFAWAWATRLLVNVGNALGTLYLLYFLTDAVRHPDPTNGVLILTVIYAATMVATTVLFGIWSDHIGRRKVFVIASGLVMTLAAGILVVWQTWPAALAATMILGAGFGVYTSVDFALLTEVLPTAVDRAKDLGLINIANALPQVVAPALATPVLTLLGGYPVLYELAGITTLLGGVFVYRIRSVP